jgi:acetyltransferase-like isoleucine patch superfamily enzyme
MNFILKIKRRENKFYNFLYKTAAFILRLNFPVIKPVHLPLYYLSTWLQRGCVNIFHFAWSVPLFKARCAKVGKGLRLPNGIPYIVGDHLKIILGDNVSIGRTTIGASKLFDEPLLEIGSNTTIGYGTVISIAKEVSIGNNCMIAPNCIIMDSDDHPINPEKRLLKEGVDPQDVKPVKIGNNVFIGSYCAILKGVTIGDNSIISTHSVITRDVFPNSVYAGNPARPTLRDIDQIV